MGTHVSGPSNLKGSGISLKEHLNNEDLPFLFKVLSVRTALSIQAHPDLILAKELNSLDPKNYRDNNHKPEMAIALGEFEALCGFRRAEKVAEFALKYEGFCDLIGKESLNNLMNFKNEKEAIKESFERLMKSRKEDIIKSISKMPRDQCDSDVAISLFYRLNEQYPNDVGVFCVFFLNHFILKSGEAVFLAANEPHAYLKGSCIECMATSDNVVRAGLTPKHRDVEVLCKMLTYNSFNGLDELLTKPEEISGRPFAHLYRSPVPEFSVLRLEIPENCSDSCKNANLFGRSIIICTEGSAKMYLKDSEFEIELGKVFYLPSNCEFKIESFNDKCVIYQAFNPKY